MPQVRHIIVYIEEWSRFVIQFFSLTSLFKSLSFLLLSHIYIVNFVRRRNLFCSFVRPQTSSSKTFVLESAYFSYYFWYAPQFLCNILSRFTFNNCIAFGHARDLSTTFLSARSDRINSLRSSKLHGVRERWLELATLLKVKKKKSSSLSIVSCPSSSTASFFFFPLCASPEFN